jgi:hypothetical protein
VATSYFKTLCALKTFATLTQHYHTNTDGWGNKLVTIFARHLDNFIVTIKFSIFYLTRDFGSGQIQSMDNFIFRRDLQKLRHTLLAP